MISNIDAVVESATQDLTILATVKSIMRVSNDDSDDIISTFIKQSSAAIARHCDRVFGKATVTETFRIMGNECIKALILSRYPVATMTSIIEDDGTPLTLNTDFTLNKKSGTLRRLNGSGYSDWSACKITVQYDGGYQLLQELPQDLEMACISLVKSKVLANNRDPLAKRIEIPDVETIDYWVGSVGDSGVFPPEVCALIDPYRDWRRN